MSKELSVKRKKLNYTQQEVAEKLEVSRQYYNEIESGKRQPSVNVAKKIGEVLDVDWTIFFTN